jgi:hypothetical protein
MPVLDVVQIDFGGKKVVASLNIECWLEANLLLGYTKEEDRQRFRRGESATGYTKVELRSP